MIVRLWFFAYYYIKQNISLNSVIFLVDLSFKCVQGNIKELGFNGYDENHNASKKIRIIFFLKIGFFN